MISVIVPVYKVEQYLPKCVDSIVNQTYQDIEIILVDDGSPDNCPAICDEYARKDKRVKVIHKINGGLSDARNAGIKEASKNYIIFLDGDDWLQEECLIRLKTVIEKSPKDIIIGNVQYVNNDIKEAKIIQPVTEESIDGKTSDGIMSYLADKGIYWPAFRFVINRKFIIDNNLFFINGILHEDLEWVPKTLSAACSFAALKEPFYCYRKNRQGSITDNKMFANYKDMVKVSSELFEISERREKKARDYVLKGAKTALLLAFEGVKRMNAQEKVRFKQIINETAQIKKLIKNFSLMKNFSVIFGLWNSLVIYTFFAELAGKINDMKGK
ncbi:MAG: glycosyltransferase family 2 protein [Candidatus Goldbacteria bacterium]|nr:glycosyltransferase family 2 protein [Candidatus Goldiibacteriota bacterium]